MIELAACGIYVHPFSLSAHFGIHFIIHFAGVNWERICVRHYLDTRRGLRFRISDESVLTRTEGFRTIDSQRHMYVDHGS